jgi:epoxyqueuosine reductase
MNAIGTNSSRALIYDAAREAGFDLCGVAPVELERSHVDAWRNWIAEGRQGQMAYMERDARADLRRLAPWAKSVICLGLNYWLPAEQRGVPSETISIYAQGHDYHEVMKAKMLRLVETLKQQLLGEGVEFEAKVYVDTGAILERAYAEAAGLGWIGKNTCLINQQRGSWFFLGEILTSLELPPEVPAPDRCGTCTRCLDACPTGAFIAPYQLDARKCISYQTIELRGPVPEPDRAGIGGHIFGCDICQDVCPWNSRATATKTAEFVPLEILRESAVGPLTRLAALGLTEFKQAFHDSPITRSKHQGLLRNVAVAMGNTADEQMLPALEILQASGDELVAEHAQWALRRVRQDTATSCPTGQV